MFYIYLDNSQSAPDIICLDDSQSVIDLFRRFTNLQLFQDIFCPLYTIIRTIICIDDSQSVPGFVPVSVIRDRFKAKDAKANQPFDTTSQVYDDCS